MVAGVAPLPTAVRTWVGATASPIEWLFEEICETTEMLVAPGEVGVDAVKPSTLVNPRETHTVSPAAIPSVVAVTARDVYVIPDVSEAVSVWLIHSTPHKNGLGGLSAPTTLPRSGISEPACRLCDDGHVLPRT